MVNAVEFLPGDVDQGVWEVVKEEMVDALTRYIQEKLLDVARSKDGCVIKVVHEDIKRQLMSIEEINVLSGEVTYTPAWLQDLLLLKGRDVSLTIPDIVNDVEEEVYPAMIEQLNSQNRLQAEWGPFCLSVKAASNAYLHGHLWRPSATGAWQPSLALMCLRLTAHGYPVGMMEAAALTKAGQHLAAGQQRWQERHFVSRIGPAVTQRAQ
eukprot:CAMPEP_0172811804 /NCGR_PEP_ID=MMETSP1075-20121228/9640_1 /TAXON_ID=2916 /ORGANISM="Ceratium fusus, Strain PA161109" /LENGTH=209 /DNA_ID=CAMNT_0013651275 /DNA_START=16 /DNA_END=646 /DNA_ORIENTATION=+